MGINQPGQQRANHKYIARAEVNGRWRYFYNMNEVNAYKKQKNGGKTIAKAKIKKKGKGTIIAPQGHVAAASPGKIISGYRPGGEKPAGMSDEAWARLQQLWSQTTTTPGMVRGVKTAPGKGARATNRHAQAVASSGYRYTPPSGSGSSGSSSSKKSYTPIKVSANDVFKATNTLLSALTALRKKKS